MKIAGFLSDNHILFELILDPKADLNRYEHVFMSRVFTFTRLPEFYTKALGTSDEAKFHIGGTGFYANETSISEYKKKRQKDFFSLDYDEYLNTLDNHRGGKKIKGIDMARQMPYYHLYDFFQKDSFRKSQERDKYFVLPFIKRQFAEDIKWLLKQNSNVVVKYFPLMLYFYISYSIMQTLMFMNKVNWKRPTDKPCPITFMLSSEKASEGQPAVKKGWAASDHLPESFLNKMSSYAQALDILNSMFEDEEELMTFQDILARFEEMDFDSDAKSTCENVLERYQTLKRDLLSDRSTETDGLPEAISTEVNDYQDFVDKLLRLCMDLQSKDYPRMKGALYSLVNIKLYEKRREHSVLVLDEDMLLLLVAIMAKDDRIRMEDLYKRFREYGIDFSFQTKNAISDYLMKLNLLERKSDSGEAQYVRIVL